MFKDIIIKLYVNYNNRIKYKNIYLFWMIQVQKIIRNMRFKVMKMIQVKSKKQKMDGRLIQKMRNYFGIKNY